MTHACGVEPLLASHGRALTVDVLYRKATRAVKGELGAGAMPAARSSYVREGAPGAGPSASQPIFDLDTRGETLVASPNLRAGRKAGEGPGPPPDARVTAGQAPTPRPREQARCRKEAAAPLSASEGGDP